MYGTCYLVKKVINFAPVEKVLGFDPNRIWYQIPNFPGYEISNDNYVRSMKHFNKYPYGILLKPTVTKSGLIKYQLSDYRNKRITISLNEIIRLIHEDPNWTQYRFSRTEDCNKSSRNRFTAEYNVKGEKYIPTYFTVMEDVPSTQLSCPLIFHNPNIQ